MHCHSSGTHPLVSTNANVVNPKPDMSLSAPFFFLCYFDNIMGNVTNDWLHHALGLSPDEIQ